MKDRGWSRHCTTILATRMPGFRPAPCAQFFAASSLFDAILCKWKFHGRGENMNAPQSLHDKGQSLWLDNITRDLLDNGTLKRYIEEFSVTGLTSNPTIFEHAISKSKSYDAEIDRLMSGGLSGEELFFELALQDLTRAADLFAQVHERTAGNDGFVSLEVSPLLAYDTKGSA